MSSAIYIHFPFCLYKCHYCDFNSHLSANLEMQTQEMVLALLQEHQLRLQLDDQSPALGLKKKSSVASVFLGGGTPSLMNPKQVEKLLQVLGADFNLTPDCEITLEANPGTLTLQKIKDFKQAGISRISIGVQSFSEHNLQTFGRIHTGHEAKQAVLWAVSVPNLNVSLDLIYGFPQQLLKQWQSDLETAISFSLEHISCYALTAEPQTRYTRDLEQKKHVSLVDDAVADMQDWTTQKLAQNGYLRYEVSNYARQSRFCRHNLVYWQYESYLGLGAGAVGQFWHQGSVFRVTNKKNPGEYVADVKTGLMAQIEHLTGDVVLKEFCLMGLRSVFGIEFADFKKRTGLEFSDLFGPALIKAKQLNWVCVDAKHVWPTNLGFDFNHGLVKLFWECL